MRIRLWAAAAACALIAAGAHAADLGMEAPELEGLQWIMGEPVSIADGKGENIYVVEFWATWCGPCIMSIPHLTELQKEYAEDNVVIIGISDEDRDMVAQFAESQGEKMQYHVAVAPQRGPHKAYMEAFEQGGIPTAFVVDKDGRIAWYGHPMALDAILPGIIDGSYDIDEARLEMSAMQDIRQLEELAFMGQQDEFHERATAVLEDYAELPTALLELAWLIFNIEGMNEANIELGARLAKTGFEGEEDPRGVSYLVYAVSLAEQDKQDEAIAVIKTGLGKVDDEQERLRNIMQMLLEEWEGGASAARQ